MTDPFTYLPLTLILGAWAVVAYDRFRDRRDARRAVEAYLDEVWDDVEGARS